MAVLLFTVLSGEEGSSIPSHILTWKFDCNLEVTFFFFFGGKCFKTVCFTGLNQLLTFALDPILLSLHLIKWCVGLEHNSTCHLSVSGTFPVLQVPRLRAAFPVFPRRHAPSAKEDLQGAVWVPAHGLNQQGLWEVWPGWSRWFVTWISKHLFEFLQVFQISGVGPLLLPQVYFLPLTHFTSDHVLFFNVQFGFIFNFMDSVCVPPIFNIYYPNACI